LFVSLPSYLPSFRFRSEETSPRDVCLWSGFPTTTCAQNNGSLGSIIEPVINLKPSDNNTSEGDSPDEAMSSGEESVEDSEANNEVEMYSSHVTWSDLERVDMKLTDEVRVDKLQ